MKLKWHAKETEKYEQDLSGKYNQTNLCEYKEDPKAEPSPKEQVP